VRSRGKLKRAFQRALFSPPALRIGVRPGPSRSAMPASRSPSRTRWGRAGGQKRQARGDDHAARRNPPRLQEMPRGWISSLIRTRPHKKPPRATGWKPAKPRAERIRACRTNNGREKQPRPRPIDGRKLIASLVRTRPRKKVRCRTGKRNAARAKPVRRDGVERGLADNQPTMRTEPQDAAR